MNAAEGIKARIGMKRNG